MKKKKPFFTALSFPKEIVEIETDFIILEEKVTQVYKDDEVLIKGKRYKCVLVDDSYAAFMRWKKIDWCTYVGSCNDTRITMSSYYSGIPNIKLIKREKKNIKSLKKK